MACGRRCEEGEKRGGVEWEGDTRAVTGGGGGGREGEGAVTGGGGGGREEEGSGESVKE